MAAYLDFIHFLWFEIHKRRNSTSKKSSTVMLLFAGDQVIISYTEDNLQKVMCELNHIITEYGLTISVQKTKLMAFQGWDPVGSKIVINNRIIDQVNSFHYIGSLISFEKELDIDNKLNNYLKITGIINNMFRPQKTRKLCITPALWALLYGSENWTLKQRDISRITAAEMKYMRKTAGCTWYIIKQIQRLQKN